MSDEEDQCEVPSRDNTELDEYLVNSTRRFGRQNWGTLSLLQELLATKKGLSLLREVVATGMEEFERVRPKVAEVFNREAALHYGKGGERLAEASADDVLAKGQIHFESDEEPVAGWWISNDSVCINLYAETPNVSALRRASKVRVRAKA